MNVPFISSGALSRAHYALVRNIEESTSEAAANRSLESEVEAIRLQLAQPGLSLKKIKEALVLLLYCSMTATIPIFPKGSFDFAFQSALGLAEAGTTVEDKRIGYLYCAEMMPLNHEMRLMLVNTLRKASLSMYDDLEDNSVSRMCLALDNIVVTPSAYIIPAVQGRLYDLLSHNHPSVRKRALYALRSLSHCEPELLSQNHSKILKRLDDQDEGVACAASRVAATHSQVNPELASITEDALNNVFESRVQAYTPEHHGLVIVLLGVLHSIGYACGFTNKADVTFSSVRLRILNLPVAFNLLVSCSSADDASEYVNMLRKTYLIVTVTMLGLYRLFEKFDAPTLYSVEEQTHTSLVGTIRNYLTAQTPNEKYIFLSCIGSVDPNLWAGRSNDMPAILEGWEVEKIMQLLDSNDDLIRKKTLRLLSGVDQGIVNEYYIRAISATTRTLPFRDLNEKTRRLLGILEILFENGELYAKQVRTLLAQLEPHVAGNEILDSAIECVLTHIRSQEASFRVSCAATILTTLCDTDVELGPTIMIIAVALATEYFRSVSLAPTDLLLGICHRLKGNLSAVQEPCILAMLRIVADSEGVPADVRKTVSEVSETGARHIRHRCEQFLALSEDKAALLEIISTSRSSTLPDLLEALETHRRAENAKTDRNAEEAKIPRSSAHTAQIVTTPGTSTNKLRYKAYDTPQAVPSLRARRTSNSPGSASGSRSDVGPSDSHSSTSTVRDSHVWFLATGSPPSVKASNEGIENARVDLIAFDSPSVMELVEGDDSEIQNARMGLKFEDVWNSVEPGHYDVKGWCDGSTDDVVKQLRGLHYRLEVTRTDVPPFFGIACEDVKKK
ncbi:hypothetical protein AGABI1DRAFT_37340 [Agaricus bisporus var. burnettii JB137-S8]|uniref:Clathrin/coatomer adaptor adaptin-like N-terminal domain-containing protein n=1 Tax=Agaricus bisporus var. burnettii (strain JB137-S8 / ATCC MYA-4627 / FGSC 10392) TaxID=597362 RepID=K5W1Y2_AGABU|nr:uncharacterized protein AGABI1DRAFT_37340 [Agaricus bisporus var. burnettii JB137-S8]EKM80809.1 hypothetical protein AGABI1DRAFT_37340 [Agaricus bisporus var. burnettii JB137-S8]